jgi:thiol-disulfide isomerase/thioredoxin
MDRLQALSLLTAVAAGLVGCGGDEPAEAPAAATVGTRVEGIAAAAPTGLDAALRDTCDVVHRAEEAPAFAFPATTEPPAVRPGAFTWVNFWATWCQPCVEEMPMLIEAFADTDVGLAFVSADADDALVAGFRGERSMPPSGARLLDSGALGTALNAVGFAAPASLPVHVLLDERGNVRCVRAGAVERRHVDTVLAAMGQGTARRRIR